MSVPIKPDGICHGHRRFSPRFLQEAAAETEVEEEVRGRCLAHDVDCAFPL